MEEGRRRNPKADKTEKKPTSIAELPIEILIDILSRLPITSVMQCKLVCKSFDSATSPDTEFSRLHLSRSGRELILCTPDLEKLIIVDTDTDDTDRAHELNLRLDDMELVNSCRGLLCLRPRYVTEPIRILNPVTLEFVMVPYPSIPNIEGVMLAGLGYSPSTNQYKVLMFLKTLDSNDKKRFTTLIYTLGTPSWRRISLCPMREFTEFFSAFLNGSLHFIMNEFNADYSYGCMTSFDFNTEKFTKTKLPPPFALSMSGDGDYVRVLSFGVFEGFLTVCLLDEDRSIHVWIMNKSNKRKKWSLKMFIDTVTSFVPEDIECSFPVKFIINNMEPTLIYVVDDVLMTNKMQSIGNNCWMTNNVLVKKLTFSSENPLSKAFMHDPILIPLKELVRGVKVHSLKPTGRKVWTSFTDEEEISSDEEEST